MNALASALTAPVTCGLAPDVQRALRGLLHLDGGQYHSCISARCEHGARAVDVDRPLIAVLIQGRKRVQHGGQELHLAPGELLLVSQPCRLDVVNVPDPHFGEYLTLMLPLCDDVLDAVRLLWGKPVRPEGPECAAVPVQPLAEPLIRCAEALQRGATDDARIAMAQLVFRLCQLGHARLLAPPSPTLAAQIRSRISAAPAQDWRSSDLEHALGMSGATLRRRLAAEGTSLRELIVQARLAAGLNLLYTTRWPVKTVAARVGYRSSSSFAQQFAERYGLEPSQIGNSVPA